MEKFSARCTIPVNIDFWDISNSQGFWKGSLRWKTHHKPYQLSELHFFLFEGMYDTWKSPCWIKIIRKIVEQWLRYLLNSICKFEQIWYKHWNIAKNKSNIYWFNHISIQSLIKQSTNLNLKTPSSKLKTESTKKREEALPVICRNLLYRIHGIFIYLNLP